MSRPPDSLLTRPLCHDPSDCVLTCKAAVSSAPNRPVTRTQLSLHEARDLKQSRVLMKFIREKRMHLARVKILGTIRMNQNAKKLYRWEFHAAHTGDAAKNVLAIVKKNDLRASTRPNEFMLLQVSDEIPNHQ